MPTAENFRGLSSVSRDQLSDEKKKPKCIVLFSGGLDSSLTAFLLKSIGIEVTAVHFLNGFSISRKKAIFSQNQCSSFENLKEIASKLQIQLKIIDISKEFAEIVVNPKYGYGANANPCVDCKILMLKKAKEIMEKTGADFVATGEVLGQRPMSQRLDTFSIIERDSGLKGKLLRPLSAKLLPETEMEKTGLIDRDKLLSISGRGRKTQIQYASKIGIEDLVSSTSGCCLLTDPRYGEKFKDKTQHCKKKLDLKDFELLMIGRHFRISETLKFIVGRNLEENEVLEKFCKGRLRFECVDVKGPIGITDESIPIEEQIILCASILARYSDGKKEKEVWVEISENNEIKKVVKAKPLSDNKILKLRV
jgi:tRNA U34 2-thiouridine synthase MnmA/TrmU